MIFVILIHISLIVMMSNQYLNKLITMKLIMLAFVV